MKKNPKPEQRGRKKFSAGKLISPENDLWDNLAIAGMGDFALTDKQDREIVSLVAFWKSQYAPAFEAPPYDQLAAATRQRTEKRILRIITDALGRMDAKPFETFARSIKFIRDAKLSGPLLRDTFEVLRVAGEMELTLGQDVLQTVSPKEFKARLGRTIPKRQYARIKKQIGLHFQTVKPKG